jgi:hypothetical protein
VRTFEELCEFKNYLVFSYEFKISIDSHMNLLLAESHLFGGELNMARQTSL